MPVKPLFSVVIPVYNREREIRRALESCMAQQNADYEVIVVDDASRDRTALVVSEYANRRVQLIRNTVNLGSSSSRASGIRASKGEWIVRLDSDDELAPGALQKAGQCVATLPANIGRIGLMYRYDDGRISPFPPPNGEILSYEGFLRWLENSELYDCLTIMRRDALEEVPLFEARLMEILHHLDFAKRFDTLWLPEVGLLYHVDAADRQSKTLPSLAEACENEEEVDLIMERHGETLARVAPKFYAAQRRRKIVSLAFAYGRGPAVREALRQLKAFPFSPLHWAALVSVVLGRRPLTLAVYLKWWLLERRRIRFCRAPDTPRFQGS